MVYSADINAVIAKEQKTIMGKQKSPAEDAGQGSLFPQTQPYTVVLFAKPSTLVQVLEIGYQIIIKIEGIQ